MNHKYKPEKLFKSLQFFDEINLECRSNLSNADKIDIIIS